MKEYILPVRDLVVHPDLTVPVYVDNPLSIACIERATKENQKLVLISKVIKLKDLLKILID